MINESLKDLLSFKGKGGEVVFRERELDSLGNEMDRISGNMDKFSVEYKDLFNQPWQYYLYLSKHAGRFSLMWRKKGVGGRGQSVVKFDDEDFVEYRRSLTASQQALFDDFEISRLVLNYEYYVASSKHNALRRLHKALV